MNLDQFHHTNKGGTPTGVYDFAIFDYLSKQSNMFVIGGTPYLYEGGVYKPDIYGTRLKTEIKELIYPQFVRSSTIERIFKLFLIDNSLQLTTENLNHYPKHWILFQNGFYDPIKEELIPVSPSYKAVNQIPHEYHPERQLQGSTVDAWLQFIAPDPDDREMLLQYLGYCMTADCRQQKFLILVGVGGSGKSTLIKLLEGVIGEDNISNVSLKQLSQRFAPYGLLGKLLNSCADLETGALEDVSLLKKILGEDSMSGEQKGKDAVSFKSYAKLIFSTNELPLVLNEKTNGFYRRLLVLKMDRQPSIKKHDFLETLESERDYFIQLCMQAVGRMYRQGYITESWNSYTAVSELRTDSDTVEAWLAERCTLDADAKVERTALFNNYETYCSIVDRTALTRNGFFRSLRIKGYRELKTTIDGVSGARCFQGIALGKNTHTVPDDPSLPY